MCRGQCSTFMESALSFSLDVSSRDHTAAARLRGKCHHLLTYLTVAYIIIFFCHFINILVSKLQTYIDKLK